MNTTPPPQDNLPHYPPPQGYPPPQQGGGAPPPQGYQPQGYPPQYGGYSPYNPQPPKRSPNVAAIIASVIALLAVAALVVVLAVPSVRAAIFPPAATATLEPTLRPTNTIQPTARPSLTPTKTLAVLPTETAQAGHSDYSQVGFIPGILPAGFEVLTEAEANAMGLDVTSFASSISGFTDAPVQAVSDPNAFQITVAVVAAPLSSSEQTLFDSGISDPEAAAAGFAMGLGAGADSWVMDGGDIIGDKSLGLGVTMSSSGISMGGEVVIARRGEALQMVIYLYLEGATQQVTALNLADAIDFQIQQVQN
jgi:hypothetical protein